LLRVVEGCCSILTLLLLVRGVHDFVELALGSKPLPTRIRLLISILTEPVSGDMGFFCILEQNINLYVMGMA
jgi:hypothetical protein